MSSPAMNSSMTSWRATPGRSRSGQPTRPAQRVSPPRRRLPERTPAVSSHRRALNRADGPLSSEAGPGLPETGSSGKGGSTRQARRVTGPQVIGLELRLWSRSDSNRRPSDYESDAPRRPGWLQTDGACSRWMCYRSRRIQKDRLDDHRDDQGASDKESDGQGFESLLGLPALP